MSFHDTYRFGVHAIIANADGKLLLLKRTYGNKGWSLPEAGSTPANRMPRRTGHHPT
ncbi:hypothetical protein [Paenibacillus lautus]|uniref:hypothetical protein n=1 Tax=Paenibacillus lautus TaxID=1401 RepID=UPI001FD3F5B1|nr:hypothetical protein [Paenibacillus lautus]